MNKKNLFYTLLSVAVLLVAVAVAVTVYFSFRDGPVESKTYIIAKVGKEAITNLELEKKIDLILIRSGNPIDHSDRKLLKDAAIESLVQEKVYWKRGTELGIEVKKYLLDSEVKKEIDNLGIKSDPLYEAVIANEIKAAIAWGQILRVETNKFNNISISDKEINKYIDKIISKGSKEFFVQMIMIPQEKLAKEVQKQIISKQITFDKASEKFSKLPQEKSKNGIIGWVSGSALPAEIDSELSKLKEDSVSDVIESNGVYYIIKLHKKRDVSLPSSSLSTYSAVSDKDNKSGIKFLTKLKKEAQCCEQFYNMTKKSKDATWEYKSVEVSDAIYPLVKNLDIDLSTPLLTKDDKTFVYMLCGYKESPGFNELKKNIKEVIIHSKKIKEASSIAQKLIIDADIIIY